MRSLLLIITALLSLAIAALGYMAYNRQISFGLYIIISAAISIGLIFLCGHFIYLYLKSLSKN